jgi:hypothetical protein
MVTDKPKWHPEYFDFNDVEEENAFKKIFNLLTPTIILYNNLKKQYGEYRADKIIANIAIPVQLAMYPQFGWIPKNRTDIDEWRQSTADAWGNKCWKV